MALLFQIAFVIVGYILFLQTLQREHYLVKLKIKACVLIE